MKVGKAVDLDKGSNVLECSSTRKESCVKHIGNTVQKLAVLFAVSILLFVAGCAMLEQNIAESKKEYIIPSKEIHIVDMNNYPFCEIGLITGTSKSNAVANIWNTTGTSDCPPDKIAAIESVHENGI